MPIAFIQTPLDKQLLHTLRAGDEVAVTGTVYTARDAAHKRLVAMLEKGQELPFPLEGALVYYVGPTPAPEGHVIGACGPTTSVRMDAYAPALIERGLGGMMGKGLRGETVVAAMRRHGAVYFGALGGAGALLARYVRACEPIAFHDLGTEAVHKLEVEAFPAVVLIDAHGGNLYESGPRDYLASLLH